MPQCGVTCGRISSSATARRNMNSHLQSAMASTQYVLLGAGFDTFPYRQPVWARGLSIIEVDHPTSQALKR